MAEFSHPPPDRVLARLADRQHGVVAVWQCGLSADVFYDRARSGRLHRIHRGVYAVGHRRLTRKGRWMAALLAHGPQGVLSHRAALALWDLRPPTVFFRHSSGVS